MIGSEIIEYNSSGMVCGEGWQWRRVTCRRKKGGNEGKVSALSFMVLLYLVMVFCFIMHCLSVTWRIKL